MCRRGPRLFLFLCFFVAVACGNCPYAWAQEFAYPECGLPYWSAAAPPAFDDLMHAFGSDTGTYPNEFDISLPLSPFKAFSQVFDLYLTDGVSARWSQSEFQQLIGGILNNDTLAVDDDVFGIVWGYFCREDADLNDHHAGVEFSLYDDTTVYRKIEIRLYDRGELPDGFSCPTSIYGNNACRGYSWVERNRLYINATPPSSMNFVLGQGIAHELQHVCWSTNGIYYLDWGYFSCNETMSTLAEYFLDSWRPPNDQSYDASFMRGENCDQDSKYQTEKAWVIYLYEAFKGSVADPTDDAIYQWIRSATEPLTRMSLPELADELWDPAFDWVGGDDAADRLDKVFANFLVAKFCNAPAFAANSRFGVTGFNTKDDLHFFADHCTAYPDSHFAMSPVDCPGAEGYSNPLNVACWNVRVLLPEHDVTDIHENTMTTVSGIYEDGDAPLPTDDGDQSTDYIDVFTYGTDYVIFRAGDYYSDGEEHEFEIRVEGNTRNKPPGYSEPWRMKPIGWVMGYCCDDTNLQVNPQNLVFVEPLVFSPSTTLGDVVTSRPVIVTDFGRSIKAVVLAIGATSVYPFTTPNNAFIYEYDFGVYTPGALTRTWEGDVFLLGDVTVPSGGTLAINAGTNVRVFPQDLAGTGTDLARNEITVSGTLAVNGTPTTPVIFQPFGVTTPGANDWAGINYAAGSGGSVSNAVISNAAKAISNTAPVTLTNCTITGCAVAIDAHANLTATGSVIVNNSDSFTAADLHSGTATFTKCTFAYNAGAAVAAQTSGAPVINQCVIASNGGPTVRALGGTATMENTVVFGNGTASGSLTDLEWQTTGQSVWNENPAFCNAGSADYRLYAFSPAAAGPHFTERVGALDVGCVPSATVTVTTLPIDPPGPVPACPVGDGDVDLKIEVDFDNAVMTRDVGANEITLDLGDMLPARVFEADGVLSASAAATVANGYTATIQHRAFGGCSYNDAADVLLNGFALAQQATVTIRTPDFDGDGAAADIQDFAFFGTGYPVDPALNDCRDFNNDNKVSIYDFVFYTSHLEDTSPYSPANAPTEIVQSNAGVALRFTEEFPTATSHRLYVDVGVENFAGVKASLFALGTASDRLQFAEWREVETTVGSVLFAPNVRNGAPAYFVGVVASTPFDGSAVPLGQLVFDVSGTEPFEVTEDDFVLTVGDVLLESGGNGPVAASMSGVVGRTLGPAVARVYHNRLEQNFPNPFNPSTTIAFSLKDAANVDLTIYDVAGRRVRNLVDERRDRGVYQITWDGQNDSGSRVASGVYFYKMIAGSFTDTKKLTILK